MTVIVLKKFSEREFLADQGILYIAFGDSFTKEAIMSYRSLRRYMKNVPVCFMTDSLDRLADLDDKNLIKVKIAPRHKLTMYILHHSRKQSILTLIQLWLETFLIYLNL